MIDGPGSDLALVTGLRMSVARDGTGGLVYLKQVGGEPHVFVSSLAGGAFEPSVQLDSGLSLGSSAPVIAAGNGGLLVVAFVSGGDLYTVQRLSAQGGFGAPQPLVSGAATPAISITNFGKAYLAFTVPDGSGYDVRAAYFYLGKWALEPTALNVKPGDAAGTGSGRPAVAAAGDGVAILAWGENGGIYSRRVWGTAPSTVYEQADGPLSGCTEISADDPVVASEGDSSYADVAFQEQLVCAGQRRSRVLMNRLRGSAYDGLTQPDGLSSSSPDGAGDPQIAMGEYGAGLVVSQRTSDNNIYATVLGSNGASGSTVQVNGLPLAQPPAAIAAMAGLSSDLTAWQQTPGGGGPAEIRVRYAPDGANLGPELVLSTPTAGPSNAADGLAADGDAAGDVAVAWLQGTGAQSELLAARLYQPPGDFAASHAREYERTATPTLSWVAPKTGWGPITYSVSLDGTAVGQTTATSLSLTGELADGPHTWQVTATNPAGQTNATRPATVFVDTLAPALETRVPARAQVGARVIVHLNYSDAPPAGQPSANASGVAKVRVGWGDGASTPVPIGTHAVSHSYVRVGRYSVTVVATDAAGNATTHRLHVAVRAVRPRRGHVSQGRR